MERFLTELRAAKRSELLDEDWLTSQIAHIGLYPDDRNDLVYGDDHVFQKNEGLWQIPRQLAQYLIYVNKPRTLLDIGTFQGYTITVLCVYFMCFVPDLTIDTIDVNHFLSPDIKQIWAKYNLPINYILMNKKTDNYLNYTRGPYDMVFIDGDHSYEGVSNDFERAKTLSSSFTFHDINDQWCPGVLQLWNENKNETSKEFTWHSRNYKVMGIGTFRTQ